MPRLGRGFGPLWAANAVSNVGDGITLAAGPLLVASLTDDPALIAGAAFAQQLPWLLFSLISGAYVDRLDRRLLVVLVNLVRATVLGVLAVSVATGSSTVLLIYLAFFVLGTAETLADNATVTLLSTVVPADAAPVRERAADGHPDPRQPARRAAGGRVALRGRRGAALRRQRGHLPAGGRPADHAAPARRPGRRPRPGRAPAAAGGDRGGGALAVAPPGAADARRLALPDEHHLLRRVLDPGAVRAGPARPVRGRVRACCWPAARSAGSPGPSSPAGWSAGSARRCCSASAWWWRR